MVSWSTFEGPDFRYLITHVMQGDIISIVLFVCWLGLFFLLLKNRAPYNKKLAEESAQ